MVYAVVLSRVTGRRLSDVELEADVHEEPEADVHEEPAPVPAAVPARELVGV